MVVVQCEAKAGDNEIDRLSWHEAMLSTVQSVSQLDTPGRKGLCRAAFRRCGHSPPAIFP
jgi:hypothetical protein